MRPAPNLKALVVVGAGVTVVVAAVIVEIAAATAEAGTNLILTAPIWRDLDRGREHNRGKKPSYFTPQ
jgi:hypothetical protein